MNTNSKKQYEKFEAVGIVDRILRDKNGNIIEEHRGENLIVDAGKNRMIRNIYDGTDIRLVGCIIGRDLNSPTNVSISNSDGWIPQDPRPEDTLSTIIGDGKSNPKQQAFNKIEFLNKEDGVLGIITDTQNTMANASWANVHSIRYYNLFKSSEVNMIVNCVGMVMSSDPKTSENLFSKHTFPYMYLMADRGYSLEIIWTYKIK